MLLPYGYLPFIIKAGLAIRNQKNNIVQKGVKKEPQNFLLKKGINKEPHKNWEGEKRVVNKEPQKSNGRSVTNRNHKNSVKKGHQ